MQLHQHTPFLVASLALERRLIEEARQAVARLSLQIEATDLTVFGLAFADDDAERTLFDDPEDATLLAARDLRDLLARREEKVVIMDARLRAWSEAHDPALPVECLASPTLALGLLEAAQASQPGGRHSTLMVACDVLLQHVPKEKLGAAYEELGASLRDHASTLDFYDECHTAH